MSEIIPSSLMTLPGQAMSLPEPRVDFTIRAGVPGDVPFIDALQKKHGKQVGWMPTKQLEGKVAAGHVLIAEATDRIGYVIGNDRYFKRDDCGIIYQMNVVPGNQRKLVGATLLQALFERSAYGCKLYCCWCAQDIEANRFWEACGFVPLAFRSGGLARRAGSEKKARVHIFWQKRIRAGDVTTPWWYPTETSGGSIRENRVVLPILPGTHWSDPVPQVFPKSKPATETETRRIIGKRTAKVVAEDAPKKLPLKVMHGLRYESPKAERPAKKEKAPKPKAKNDPVLVAKARELRDRWLEQANAQGTALPIGKYDVAKASPTNTARIAA